MTHSTEQAAEWREQIGERLMLAMTCYHGSDYFGSGAVCETCWTNVQRIGRIIERERAAAWDEGMTAALGHLDDYKPNPYRRLRPAEDGAGRG